MSTAVGAGGPAGWGVRRRSVLTAVVVVGLALVVGAVLLLVLLQTALVATVRTEVTDRCSDIAALVASDGLDPALVAVRQGGRRGEETQVVDAAGRVLAASDPRLIAPLSPSRPPEGETAVTALPGLPAVGAADDQLVAARRVVAGGTEAWVLVAAPVQVQADTVQTVAVFLLAALPLLLLLVGLAVWVLVGRSLQSVERIRAQVAAIDPATLADRVEVPPTGDEIALLATTMNGMLDRLHEADLASRTFLSDAGHELRSPLATLVAAIDLLESGAVDRSELQPVIRAEAQRLQRLVEDLLTLAKADAGTLLPALDDVDVDDVLAGEVRRLRALGGSVTARLPPARVRGDAGRLGQVFRNLLDNAARYAVHEIAVTVAPEEEDVLVHVDDDGPPVPPDQRERVFERFVRLDPSRDRDEGGSGLGLAISTAVVAAHGGRLTTGASPEGWCRFTVRLPRSPG